MSKKIKSQELIIPVYINEKIVLDMLAIMEDGFSTVSQVNYTEQKENTSSQNIGAGVSTSASILSKLLKIDLKADFSHSGNSNENESIAKEKVHTNVSLLSKFRSFLIDEKILKSDFNISDMKIGDFIEVEGELQKNPLINYMDNIIDMFRLGNIFSDEPELGNKTQSRAKQKEDDATLKQMKKFSDELRHSGTIDFILSDNNKTVVLSAQEKYLSNDNISEILGGRFKILGKVIAICKDDSEEIDLLRKTTLSIFSDETLEEVLGGFSNSGITELNLPELVTKIAGPAVIVLPIAIYA